MHPLDARRSDMERFEEDALCRVFSLPSKSRATPRFRSLLRGGLPGARWIDVENYHITLRFIGDVEGHVADEVANALDRVRRPEFMLNLSGVNAFGSKKPHSIYAGVSPRLSLTPCRLKSKGSASGFTFPPTRASSRRM